MALVLTPLIIRLSKAVNLLDAPGPRKIHSTPIPRLGGLAIAAATLVPFVATLIWRHDQLLASRSATGEILTLISAATGVLLLGLIDDLINLPAKLKLLVLLGAAAALCASCGGGISEITFCNSSLLNFGSWSWPVTIIFINGIVVSMNFIDGLDGLAAGISIAGFAVLAVGAAAGGQTLILLLAICMIFALAGFLVFNFYPAKVFMGDSGSLFIGFVLAGSCVLASRHIGTTRGIILPSLAISIPLLDTALTMVRRSVLHRQSLFTAERGHIHHRLLDIGFIHRHAVLILYAVTLTATGVALVTYFSNPLATGLSATGFILALALLFRVSGSVRARETLDAFRRNRAIRRQRRRYQAIFDELRVAFRDEKTFEGWWRCLCRGAEKLDIAKLELPVKRRNGSASSLTWKSEDGEVIRADSISAEVPVRQRRQGENLRLEVEVAANKCLENAGFRVALLSQLMNEFSLARLPVTAERGGDSRPPRVPVPQRDSSPLPAAAKSPEFVARSVIP
jgi:UDP-N-acetylmuramyl pentapeptide phosphotransferase/UDP-N-acetylglucosamine-1-phosphate transferase